MMEMIKARNGAELEEQVDQWCRARIETNTEKMRADGVPEDQIEAAAEMVRAAFRKFKEDMAETIRDAIAKRD